MKFRRPTRAEVLAAAGRKVPDVIAPDLRVLFCGINPGLYSGATGHHFARPGNRFWPALHAGGFTPRIIAPWEERELLGWGYGITNLVARATVAAAELRKEEFIAGAKRLARKVTRYRPRWVAVVGIGAYRAAFGRPKAVIGEQPERLGSARLWLLPQPSGLNANHQMPELTAAFRALYEAARST
ncbi:MAG TPA: G/U mismatch-specific DNA glycosylase [Steroidobacteraceae bacterium]|nr:G/U mismatch-specific DNA glycosylase [Steroidobacteraceae bacterium]